MFWLYSSKDAGCWCVAVWWKVHQRHLRQTEKQVQAVEVNRISCNEAVLQQHTFSVVMMMMMVMHSVCEGWVILCVVVFPWSFSRGQHRRRFCSREV